MELTLCQKPYGAKFSDISSDISSVLQDQLSGLAVKWKVLGADRSGWIKVDLYGEDYDVARKLLNKKLGLVPTGIENVERGDVVSGYVEAVRVEGLVVDLGVRGEISERALRSQLADGKPVPVREISKKYCLVEGLRLEARVTRVNAGSVKLWLSDDFRDRLLMWKRIPVDRVIVIGAPRSLLEKAVALGRMEWDIPEITTFGLCVHALMCKVGTDAPGVIAKLGRYLGAAKLYAFRPGSGIGGSLDQ